MRRIVLALALLGCCGLTPAQTKPDNQLSPNVRIYEPKVTDGSTQLGKFVQSVVPGVTINWEPAVHALVLRGAPADLDVAEALLKRFDLPTRKPAPPPAPQVELKAYLIRAWSTATPVQVSERPIPAELESAIEEMKQTFAYPQYGLWDVIIANIDPSSGSGEFFNSGGGAGELGGLLPPLPNDGGTPYTYSLTYKYPYMKDPKSVALRGFEFTVKMPWGKDGLEAKIKTEPVIHEGQKMVLGKIRLLPGSNADLWLVLTVKFR
jgi:hypothetical protein